MPSDSAKDSSDSAADTTSTKPKSWCYLRNLMGQTLDDESMKAIPHAQAELYYHVALKTAQAGAIMGTVIGSASRAIRGGRTASVLTASALNGAKIGMLVGVPLGILMTYGRMQALQKAGDVDMDYAYFDRSYRLRHNQNQVRVDRASYLGEGVGIAAAVTTGSSLLAGAAVGLAAGTIAGGIYNGMNKKNN